MKFRGKEYKMSTILPWIGAVVGQYKLRMSLNIILGWIVVLLNFVFVWATKQAIDAATVYHNSLTVKLSCALLVLVIILQAVISACNKRIKTMLSFRMNRRMQETLLGHALSARWGDVGKYHTGDIVRRFEEDGSEIISFINGTIPTILLVLLQLLGAYVILFALSRQVALALAVIMVIGIFVSKFHFMKIRGFSVKIKTNGSRLQAVLQEGLQNISVLKSMAGLGFFRKYYSGIFGVQEQNVKDRLSYSILSSTVLNVGFAACYLFVFIWGVVNLETEAISYGTLMAFVQLVGQIQGPSRTLITSISDFAEFYTSCERLNEIDAIPREDDNGIRYQPSGTPGIMCENVVFKYPDGRRTIVNNFSRQFKPGVTTAIIGTTGAGKTTLMRLLLSYIKPQEGNIYVTDNSGRHPVGTDTRHLFAYVPQGNSLFSMTLRENLLLSNPDATDDEMLEVLEWASADFIRHNPQGLDTQCGESGRGLSQGQAQRLCIARALLSKAPILLMDEATSALDRNTEEKIIANIHTHVKGKTIIFITHRDTVIKYADEVVKVD